MQAQTLLQVRQPWADCVVTSASTRRLCRLAGVCQTFTAMSIWRSFLTTHWRGCTSFQPPITDNRNTLRQSGRRLSCRRSTVQASGLLGCLLVVFLTQASAGNSAATNMSWVRLVGGHLSYESDAHGNRIPDFSAVGYEEGDAPIPDVPIRAEVYPVSGGADDTARIQSTIDGLKQLPIADTGFRGSILFHAGTYRIAGTIHLDASGIVLRGEKAAGKITLLVAKGKPHVVIRIGGQGRWQQTGPSHDVLDEYVPVGATQITLDNSKDLKSGDRVIVRWSMNDEFIRELGMDSIPPRLDGGEVRQWHSGMALSFDRRIVSIESVTGGQKLTLDAPLTTPMLKTDGAVVWRYTFPTRINHVGIENLRADGRGFEKARAREYFDSMLAMFDSVEDAWIRRITVVHFSGIVSIGQFARAVTVTDVDGEHIDTRATRASPHAFGIDGQQSLVQRCTMSGSYSHVWMTQSRVAGPDVFRLCTAKGRHLDAGPHERWATGVLYEDLRIKGSILVRNRSNMGTGQGWAGAYNVVWNCESSKYVIESPPGAYNWAFGTKGSLEMPWTGQIVSAGEHIEPASLYEQQLKERLGLKQPD